jgi:hypothetical protein
LGRRDFREFSGLRRKAQAFLGAEPKKTAAHQGFVEKPRRAVLQIAIE